MSNTLDALATSDLIVESYRRYLGSLLPVREPRIAHALATEIALSTMLTKGPLLEATPAYATGATLRELIDEGVLDSSFGALAGPALPIDRPLYAHQEQAVRKVTRGRNVVVATGTGSGKTESFLLPILNSLVAEHARSELGTGVRALLLYPMNALANDQLKRLRQLLAHVPFITFGRYVGDTPNNTREGETNFESLHPDEARLPNELLSREEMRACPPHLLLTNYAMLEYLLLRPADLDLFAGQHWRFIALDEAHVYDGAKAAEVAMLLRRLRDRVAPVESLQCLATSATVGSEPGAVVDFARKLFDTPFEWVAQDPSRQDLVTAGRTPMTTQSCWGPLPGPVYRHLATLDDPAPEIVKLAKEYGCVADDAAFALRHEERMADLRARLVRTPADLAALASTLFASDDQPRESLAALVAVGSRTRDKAGSPVISARYHLFARATEGAFTCLTSAGPHVTLARHESCGSCGGAMFEFGTCKRCGAVHLTGAVRNGDLFTPQVRLGERRAWLLLGDAPTVVDQDDQELEEAGQLDGHDRFLCASCGALRTTARLTCSREGCRGATLWPVRLLNVRQASLSGCAACGARGSGMVRLFESGSDAAAAVLATALYQAQPRAADAGVADQPGEGRKLLSFSDSRQAAAFFAPYLETSYSGIQHRRLILDGLRNGIGGDEPISVDDLIFHVARSAADAHIFPRRASRQERERQVALWVMQELTAVDDRQSLEGLGLLQVGLDRDSNWAIPPAFGLLGLTDNDSWALLFELVRSLRQQGVVTMPDGVDPRDEAFDPRRGPIYVRENGSEPKRKVLSWQPTRGANRRLNYVGRILEATGSQDAAEAVLKGCWKAIINWRDGWLTTENVPQLGTVRQLDHTWLRLGNPDQLYRCDLCQRITAVSVRAVCPTLGCRGKLEVYSVPDLKTDSNHYRVLYRTINPVPMIAREHTAQWTSQEAADIQQQFVRGHVNVLSCSTTFELGVDVGDLQSVMLRNMPPTTANYVQRAGRAGRRTDAAALVVTYAQRRSHDLTCYANPATMIAGAVRAPYVPLGNSRIDRRHAHSVALSSFFRNARQTSGETWTTAGAFFLGDHPPADRVRSFLSPVPQEVDDSLRRVLPPEVQQDIGITTEVWVDRLAELLEEVRSQLSHDVQVFEERRRKAFEERKGHLVQRYEKTINTLTQRELLGYLANRNVLPKYGFPVDTVELRTNYSGNATGNKLELSRDLSAAIYDYAPGAEVVAGGLIWRSGGVYRLPGRELIGHHYFVCEQCQHYWEGDDDINPMCPACSFHSPRRPGQYYVPEFGFVADADPARTTTTPPRRKWYGATYVRSLAAETVRVVTWQAADGSVQARSGSRGQLIALSEGPTGAGYLICDWCGAGRPLDGKRVTSHTDLLRGTPCTGPFQARSLAHPYETDLLDLTFDHLAMPAVSDTASWLSLLYAFLEGAAECLELSHDDIDGTLYRRPGGGVGIVMFDTVPGGAGGVLRIANAFDRVAKAAFDRVAACECGEETSCYGCLRTFRNQRHHEDLCRRSAIQALRALLGDSDLVGT